ncbi:MAG: Glycerophosphoryl diester phosphodiesterase [bacterium ADurb.Bin236]|nr:MAG: Glycerophosphoryl diester phosphodiesterase [bacterium ADurb.Bin236]
MSVHRSAPAARPLVFAHRGGAKLAPENTLAAFDRGLEAGADGLELDVRLTRDLQPVVCHDATLDRTTDATGPLRAYDASDLAGVDAGFHFRGPQGDWPYRGRGVRLPLLADVLARYGHLPLIVELKEADLELARAVVRLFAAAAPSRACTGSFYGPPLREVRRLAPAVPTGASGWEVRMALYRSWLRWPSDGVPYRALQVPERREAHRIVSPRFVRAAHRAGVAVQVWVVDEPDRIRRLLGWGVDGIITDRPDVAAAIVADLRRG